jgi:hypothetical protein
VKAEAAKNIQTIKAVTTLATATETDRWESIMG